MNARSNLGIAEATDPGHVSASRRVRNLLDDAGGHGDLCRALPERERVGRRGASRATTSRCSSCLSPRTTPLSPSAGASQAVRLPLETDPELARREGIETISGRMTLAFGAVSFPVSRERSDAVHFLELLLAGGIAGTFGLLLTLVWTAGFVPTFLEPSAASVLLAKPIARWQLLLGKYFGVLAFVGFQVVLFVALTWLALGVRTSVWDMTYWWCIPLLLLQFAIFYSFSVLLAVVTRSTVACVFGSRPLLASGLGDQLWQRDGSRHAANPSIFRPPRSPWPRRRTGFPQAHRRGTDPVQRPERARAFREAVGLQTPRVRTRVLTATVDPLFTRDDRRVAGFVHPRVQNGGLLIDVWRDERIGISRFFHASQGSGGATSESARGPRRSAQNRSMPNRAHFSQMELTPRGS